MTPISRRAFLAAAAFLPVAAGLPRLVRADDEFRPLRTEPVRAHLIGPEMPSDGLWGFDGMVPGPVLRYRVGDTLKVRLENGLPMPTSIHWHGLRLPNAMDGVSGLTQEPVGRGETFDYAFELKDAGTFWYHSHERSWEQVARGVYGLLVVEEAEPPAVDRDLPFVVDDWLLHRDGRFVEETLGDLHDWGHGGRMGNLLTVNGTMQPDIAVRPGERLRLRLLNPANARIFLLDFGSIKPTVVALDGRPCRPHVVEARGLLLSPGQRADLIVDITGGTGERIAVTDAAYDDPVAVAHFVVDGEPLRDAPPGAQVALPGAGEGTALDLGEAVTADLLMQGGAMGTMDSAILNGHRMSWRELVQGGRVWAFNGVAGDMDAPLMELPRGRTAIVTLKNDTRWPHAMHLHGHHFQVIERDGKPSLGSPWRDTELMSSGETMRIAFRAGEPGRWMLHCHMLEHSAGGMMTWVSVT